MALNRDDLLMGFFYKLNENSLKGHWIDSDNHYWQLNTKLELIGNTHIANTQHHVTFGLASNKADNNLDAIRSTDFTLDPYAPSFDRPEPRDSAVFRGFHYRDKDNHVYIIDNMRLTEQLAITADVRYSTFFNTNRLTNTVAVDKNALTSSLGASWQPHNNITLYGGYATSFEPNTGVSRQGDYFEPLEAEQLEAGLRWYPTSAITTEIALYDLTQQNLLTRDPIDPDYQTPTGARRSRGIEIDATLALHDAYQLQVAYSHTKNKYIEDFYGRLGKTASGIARNTGALRLHWQPPAQPNWDAYVGLIGVGKRYGDAANSFSLPGYGRLDAGIRYQDQQTTYRLNIENLMDKRYIAAAFADDDLYQGKRRTINASVSYRW